MIIRYECCFLLFSHTTTQQKISLQRNDSFVLLCQTLSPYFSLQVFLFNFTSKLARHSDVKMNSRNTDLYGVQNENPLLCPLVSPPLSLTAASDLAHLLQNVPLERRKRGGFGVEKIVTLVPS